VFPDNVWFLRDNYVLEVDEDLEMVRQEYDVILALSITKWVHINWGDAGLKRFFRRAFLHLRPAGRLIVEFQAWETYAKKSKIVVSLSF
jgi:7SK snRNA methylphosphate capping enzyme